jgi:chromosomal replication initiator protein
MQAWELFLRQQEKELGQETVNKWLRPLKVMRFDACNLYLEAKDSFQVMWFEEHIRENAHSKLLNNNNKRIKVHISVANAGVVKGKDKSPKSAMQKPTGEQQAASFGLTFDELNPQSTFSHFVSSEQNLLAHKLLIKLTGYDAAADDILHAPSEIGAFNPIYVYGIGGSGKTHLLMATAHALRSHGMKVLYARAETFTEHVVSAIRAGEMSLFRQAYRNIDVLIIDDVHVFSRKTATQEELFHTFNTLHLAGKQIILSSNCSPSELQHIEPRLVSRFEWGIVLPLEPLNREEISKVLDRKMKALHFEVNNKVSEFLLDTFTSSTKSLTRAFEALVLRSHLHHGSNQITSTQLTIPLVKHSLTDLIQEEQQAVITPSKILQAVAEYYEIQTEDLLGKGQTRDRVIPRQIAMYFCRSHLKLSYVKVADLFSKDHSTVMSSIKAIKKGLDEGEPEISTALSVIQKKLVSSQ